MKKISDMLLSFQDWVLALPVSQEQWLLYAAALLFLLSLLILLRKRRQRIVSPSNVARLHDSVQKLSLELSELSSSVQNRLNILEAEIKSLQQDSSDFRKKSLAGTEEEVKKKSDSLSESEDVVVQEPASLRAGLEKTRSHFFSRLKLFLGAGQSLDKDALAALEELLITSDLGVRSTEKLISALQAEAEQLGAVDEAALRQILKREMLAILHSDSQAEIKVSKPQKGPYVVLIVGVNGVGKTTTIGKLGHQFREAGLKVAFGACDTFRAAAVEQLQMWAQRCGAECVTGREGAKPTTVAFDAIKRAVEGNFDVLLLDTAGRLHTKVNLMNELKGVADLVSRELPGAPHETILVVDGSTGQNALQQAREFNEKTDLSGVVITKLDGTPKGGIVVAIKDELQIPVRYIGVGEGAQDLRSFIAKDFLDALFGEAEIELEGKKNEPTAKARARRRRRETLAA